MAVNNGIALNRGCCFGPFSKKNELTLDTIIRKSLQLLLLPCFSGVEHTKRPMKKIVVSVGLVALGASSMHAADGPVLHEPAGKLWNVSATLRGFYDDNPNTAPDNLGDKQTTWGYELSPGFNFKLRRDTTSLLFDYRYSFIYYDDRPSGQSAKYDQNHTLNAALEHTFNERVGIRVADSFVIGQEPDLLRSGVVLETVQRLPGDNIRNSATVDLNVEVTPRFGLALGYANAFFDYDAEGAVLTSTNVIGTHDKNGNFFVGTTPSGTSDRVENSFHIDGRWNLSRTTVGFVGVQFSQINYTGNEPLLVVTNPVTLVETPIFSKNRDTRTYNPYIGVEHHFQPDFIAAARVGVDITDPYRDPTKPGIDVTPTANINLSYVYAPQSSISGGFFYGRTATDLVSASTNGTFTLDSSSATVYATLRHRIIPNLFLNLNGQWQHSAFNGGEIDSSTEDFYLFGANLEYRINRYLTTTLGYTYDRLNSDTGRSYDRNRVYIGITAGY
jgi:hypothetical protein